MPFVVADLLVKEVWSFVLYQLDDRYILSVVCGGVGQYDLDVPISANDAEAGLADITVLQNLAQDIRTHPSRYAELSGRLEGL